MKIKSSIGALALMALTTSDEANAYRFAVLLEPQQNLYLQ